MRASGGGGGGGSFARRPRRGAFQGLAGRVRRPRAQNTPAVLDSASRKCAASPSPPPPLLSPALPRCCELFTQAPLLRCLRVPLPPLVRSGEGACISPTPRCGCAWQWNDAARTGDGAARVPVSRKIRPLGTTRKPPRAFAAANMFAAARINYQKMRVSDNLLDGRHTNKEAIPRARIIQPPTTVTLPLVGKIRASKVLLCFVVTMVSGRVSSCAASV